MDALALLREHEPEIKKRFGVAKIGIFGSFIRGEERPDSDVDVLVTFRKDGETFNNYMECKFYLEDLFGRKVDLVMKGAIKKRLKPLRRLAISKRIRAGSRSKIFLKTGDAGMPSSGIFRLSVKRSRTSLPKSGSGTRIPIGKILQDSAMSSPTSISGSS
jgi:hypothetical protein